MNRPDSVDELIQQLRLVDADAQFDIDHPSSNVGTWWLNATVFGVSRTISWQSDLGFGIFDSGNLAFGDQPSERFQTASAAAHSMLQSISPSEAALDQRHERYLSLFSDVQNAERETIYFLQGLPEKALDRDLRRLLVRYVDQSNNQLQQLNSVIYFIYKGSGKADKVLLDRSLTKALAETIEKLEQDGARFDNRVASAVQTLSQYKVIRYGILSAWARDANIVEIADHLHVIYETERAADSELTKYIEAVSNTFVPQRHWWQRGFR